MADEEPKISLSSDEPLRLILRGFLNYEDAGLIRRNEDARFIRGKGRAIDPHRVHEVLDGIMALWPGRSGF